MKIANEKFETHRQNVLTLCRMFDKGNLINVRQVEYAVKELAESFLNMLQSQEQVAKEAYEDRIKVLEFQVSFSRSRQAAPKEVYEQFEERINRLELELAQLKQLKQLNSS